MVYGMLLSAVWLPAISCLHIARGNFDGTLHIRYLFGHRSHAISFPSADHANLVDLKSVTSLCAEGFARIGFNQGMVNA